ncbi:MAG: AbrB/MazE/SpoVT family DNA-binding domain-containing protein [Desulfurococcales archaeon]|nr:AbrB/MazE/SpoVT family DNA-binding domain-containing protein [Desulfurococcales archaeon]
MAKKNGKDGIHGSLLVRKVQKLGASSLIVTLPREWTRRHGISVGDNVLIHDEGDKLVIAPKNRERSLSLSFDLSKFNVSRHIGRLILFSYVFGFDGIEVKFTRPIKGEYLSRIENAVSWLEHASMEMSSDQKSVSLMYTIDDAKIEELIHRYGKSVSSLLGSLVLYLKDEKDLDRAYLEELYIELLRRNYSLLRLTNSIKPIDSLESVKVRYLSSAINLIGLVADASYKLSIDLLSLKKKLTEEEKHRLTLLLEILEVVSSTISSSLNPPSVKKNEDSYWKIKNILDLEGHIDDILNNASPAFGYILARIIDIARLLEVAENILLCHAMVEKFNKHNMNG